MRIEGVDPEQEGARLDADIPQPAISFAGHHTHVVVVLGAPGLPEAQETVDFIEEGRTGIVDELTFFIVHHAVRGVVDGAHTRIGGHILIDGMIKLMAGAELHIVEAARVAVLGQTHGRSIIDQGCLDIASPQDVTDGGIVRGQGLPAAERQGVAPVMMARRTGTVGRPSL